MTNVLSLPWEIWMWRLVSGNVMCLCIPTSLLWIMTTPSLVGYYKCCTRRDCSICSVYLSKTLVSAYTEHYILYLHCIKVRNTVGILLHWSDGFFLSIFCRASHQILCFVHYNYKYLYPVMLRHCSSKMVKLCGLVHNDVEQGVFYYNQHVSTLLECFFFG